MKCFSHWRAAGVPRCSITKGRVKPISTTTRTRKGQPGGRVILSVCGQKSVQSTGGKKSMFMIPIDFIWFNAVYFVRNKDKVFRYFRQYLADYCFTGVPLPIESLPTDDGAEVKGEVLSYLCRERIRL